VEVVFPIENPALRKRVSEEILARQLSDNTKAWILNPDGTYTRIGESSDSDQARNSQVEFMDLASAKTSKKAVRQQTRKVMGAKTKPETKRNSTGRPKRKPAR
jgi:polyphosphate kinase